MPYKPHQLALVENICANWHLSSLEDFFELPSSPDSSFEDDDAPVTTRRLWPENRQPITAVLKGLLRLSELRDVSINQVRALVSELAEHRADASEMATISPKVLREALHYFCPEPDQNEHDDENDVTISDDERPQSQLASNSDERNGVVTPGLDVALAQIRNGMPVEQSSMFQEVWYSMWQLVQDHEKRSRDKKAAAESEQEPMQIHPPGEPCEQIYPHLSHPREITSGPNMPPVLHLSINPDSYHRKRKQKGHHSSLDPSGDSSRQRKRRQLELTSLKASYDIAKLEKEELEEEIASLAEIVGRIIGELSKYIPSSTWASTLEAAERVAQVGLRGFWPSVIPAEHCHNEKLKRWDDDVHTFPERFYRSKFALDRALVGIQRWEELLRRDRKECERRSEVAKSRLARKEQELRSFMEEISSLEDYQMANEDD